MGASVSGRARLLNSHMCALQWRLLRLSAVPDWEHGVQPVSCAQDEAAFNVSRTLVHTFCLDHAHRMRQQKCRGVLLIAPACCATLQSAVLHDR
eukprot:scaffold131063_cov28-Tisochrysis_lutea.AAC.3